MWVGYADAKPSEAIQKHELPGLAVAAVFPHHPNGGVLELPVKQYKDYKPRNKGRRAVQLANWLDEQKKIGLVLSGFVQAHNQLAAAKFGLELVEELPETRVKAHFGKYRLFFGSEYIDFSEAIALEYYLFTIMLGILRARTRLKQDSVTLSLMMDRFPGTSTSMAQTEPGKPLLRTQGAKFIDFIRQRSDTGIYIEAENKTIGLKSEFGTIDWWKPASEGKWREGKTHAHFVLPDWAAAAAIANEFCKEFISTFKNEAHGIDAADGLVKLYNTLKSFDLWSLEANALLHIRAGKKLWSVHDAAREFILARAER
ncbi:MAG: hypothetical protein ACKVP5_21860 [Aestuariivirga sp.]